MELQNKVAVIFAASGAISGAVAKAIAEKGAIVYLAAKSEESVQDLSDSIKAKGGIAFVHVVDALQEEAIDLFFQKVIAEQGKVDIVFNGIGIRASQSQYGVPSSLISMENFLKPFNQIVASQFITARIGAHYMIQTGSKGTILMLTSSLSRLKTPFIAGLSAASSAIEGLTRSLAAEYGRFGVKVICLNSTAINETRSIQETTQATANTIGIPVEALAAELSKGHILGHGPNLSDVGKVAAFLVSDAGSALNSHIIDVDFGNSSVI